MGKVTLSRAWFGVSQEALARNFQGLASRNVNARVMTGVLAAHGILSSTAEGTLIDFARTQPPHEINRALFGQYLPEHFSHGVRGVTRHQVEEALCEYAELMVHTRTNDELAGTCFSSAADLQCALLTSCVDPNEMNTAIFALRDELTGSVMEGLEDGRLASVTEKVHSIQAGIRRASRWTRQNGISFHSEALAADAIKLQRMTRTLYQLTEAVTQRAEFRTITTDWWMDGSTRMPLEMKKIVQSFLKVDGAVLEELADDLGAQFSQIGRGGGEGMRFDRRSITREERKFMRDAGLLFSALETSRRAAAEGGDRIISEAEAFQKLNGLIDWLDTYKSELGCAVVSRKVGHRALGQAIGHLRVVTSTTEQWSRFCRQAEGARQDLARARSRLEAAPLSEAEQAEVGRLETAVEQLQAMADQQAQKIADDVRGAVGQLNEYVSENKSKKTILAAFLTVSTLVTAIYVVYQILMFSTMHFGDVRSAGLATGLLAAQLFYALYSLRDVLSNLKLLIKTKGATGRSHNQRITAGLEEDPRKRPAWMENLVGVDEPIAALLPNVLTHLNAIMLMGPNSSLAQVFMTGSIPTRKSLEAAYRGINTQAEVRAARKVIFEKFLENFGIDWIIANSLSIWMTCDYTELDDVEARMFSAMRCSGIARDHNIDEKKVKALGRKLATEAVMRNIGQGTFDDFLRLDLPRARLAQELVALGVPPEKIAPVAAALATGLETLVRRSRIAKSFYRIRQGEAITATQRDALLAAMAGEFGIDRRRAEEQFENIEAATRAISNPQTMASIDNASQTMASAGVFNFTRNKDARQVFHQVALVVDVVSRADKRFGQIADGLQEKLTQIVEHRVFVQNKFKFKNLFSLKRMPGPGEMLCVRFCREVGSDLAERIDKGQNFWTLVAGIAENMQRDAEARARAEGKTADDAVWSYDAAWAEALRQKQAEIGRIVEEVCRASGIESEAEGIAEMAIANFEEALRYKRCIAEDMLNQVMRGLQDKEKPEEILQGILGRNAGDVGARGVLVNLLLREESSGLRSAVGTRVEARINKICGAIGDPVANREQFIDKLMKQCGMTRQVAERFVDGFTLAHAATFGAMESAIGAAGTCREQGTIFQVVCGADEVSGEILHLSCGGRTIEIDLSEKNDNGVKQRVRRYVRPTQLVPYPGGTKGGILGSLIKGGEVGAWIGAAWQGAVATIIREQLSKEPKVSPDLTTLIDREITGAVPALIPDSVRPELRRPRWIAAQLIRNLSMPGEAGRVLTPRESAQRVLHEMGLEGVKNEDRILKRLVFVAEDIASRLDFAEIVQQLCSAHQAGTLRRAGVRRQGEEDNFAGHKNYGDVRAIVTEVINARHYTEREILFRREFERQAFKIKQALLDDVFEVAGAQGNFALRLTAAAARNCADEKTLLEEWSRIVGSFQLTARMHFHRLAIGETISANMISENSRKQIEELLDVDFPRGAEKHSAEELFTVVVNHALDGKDLDETCAEAFKMFGVAEDTAFTEELRATLTAAARVIRQDVWMSRTGVVQRQVDEVRAGGRDFARLVRGFVDADHGLKMSDTEKNSLAEAASEIVEVFADIGVKVNDGAVILGADPNDDRVLVLRAGESRTTRQHLEGTDFLWDINRRMISPRPRKAYQILEALIATNHLPNVTKGREALVGEIRAGAKAIDEAFDAQIREKLQEEINQRAAEGKTPQQIEREIAEMAFALVGAEVGKKVGHNYFEDAKAIAASPFTYAVEHVDDADYRAYATLCIDIAPYINEHDSQHMVGQRQFGRNFHVFWIPSEFLAGGNFSWMALAFQSAGSAYWNQFNKDNTLDGLVPSWGSCVAYSGDSYLESGRWTTREYYQSRVREKLRRATRALGLKVDIKDKFLISALYNALVDRLTQRIFMNHQKIGRVAVPLIRLGAWGFGLGVKVVDVGYDLTILQGLDLLHNLGKHGSLRPLPLGGIAQDVLDLGTGTDSEFSRVAWFFRANFEEGRGEKLARLYEWVDAARRSVALHWRAVHLFRPNESIEDLQETPALLERFRRPLNAKILLKKGRGLGGFPRDLLHEVWAIQDTTTESEDIASGVWFLRSVGFFNDEARNFLSATFRAWFLPRLLWASSFLEGEGPLGAHSDDLAGYNSTFGSRWGRGNIPIWVQIMATPMGAWRKAKYLSLSAYWLTGMFRQALIVCPIFFLLGNASAIRFERPTGMLGMLDEQLKQGGIDAFSKNYFISIVLLNFACTMGSFLLNMRSAGNLSFENFGETAGCMVMEWGNPGRMAQSDWEGLILKLRPPFITSPKESVCPGKMPARHMKLAYILAALNLYCAGHSAIKIIASGGNIVGAVATLDPTAVWKVLANADVGTLVTLGPAAIWNAYHGAMGAAAILFLNRGVHREMPFWTALTEGWEKVQRGYQPFLFEHNDDEGKRERKRRVFLREIEANILSSPEGRGAANNLMQRGES